MSNGSKGGVQTSGPFAIGDTIWGLTGKCMTVCIGEGEVAEFFQPRPAEKMAHALRGCTEEQWMDEDFVVLEVDMRNTVHVSLLWSRKHKGISY